MKIFEQQIDKADLMCEPVIKRMPNGELCCLCLKDGPMEPHPDNRVYAYHSKDNGRTWSEGVIVCDEGRGMCDTSMSIINGVPTLWVSPHDGYFLDWENIKYESYDNGYTWKRIGPDPLAPKYAFMRGRTDLKDGTILISFQSYPIEPWMYEAVKKDETIPDSDRYVWKMGCRSLVGGVDEVINWVMASHDNGKTWEKHEICRLSLQSRWVWSEPTVIEAEPNHVVMFTRYDGTGLLWRCDSFDGGKTWSKLVKTDVPNSGNKPQFFKLENGDIVLACTPNDKARTPESLWFSNDGLKTWYRKEVVSFDSRCDYVDGFVEGNHLYLAQEHFRTSHSTRLFFYDIEL